MFRKILRAVVMIGVLCSVGVFLSGCNGPAHYEDGKLFFVNNTRPYSVDQQVYAIFEDWETHIPFNMTADGEATEPRVGAVPLTEEPLAGGTEVTVTCRFKQQSGTFTTYKSLTIDGNTTVGAYETDWNLSVSMITLRVHRGIYNGGDPAAGGGG